MRLIQRFTNGVALRRPDLARIVFDPARVGEMLRELPLRESDDSAGGIEYQRARTRRALIQGQDVASGCHTVSPPKARASGAEAPRFETGRAVDRVDGAHVADRIVAAREGLRATFDHLEHVA